MPQGRTAGTWLITRVALVGLLVIRGGPVVGDLRYFDRSLAGVGATGFSDVMPEYPTPAALLLALVRTVSTGSGADTIRPALVLMLLAADALLTAALVRRGARAAVSAWVWGVVLLGPVTYARLDLLPGVLVAAALLAGAHRPRVAGAVLAVATGLKLWPVVALPVLLARSRSPLRLLSAAAWAGAALLTVSWVAGGWDRLFTPLAYQRDRGLQVESVAATPAMLARLLDGGRFEVGRSTYLAFEVVGPGTGVLLSVSTLLTLAWLLGLVALGARLWRAGGRPATDAVGWVVLAAVSGGVVTSKVLSPQYLLWLLPVAVAALAICPLDGRLRRWTVVLLATCALTQLVFPELYTGLTDVNGQTVPATVALALRNLLLTWLAVAAWRTAFVRLGTGATPALSPTDDLRRPGAARAA